MPSAEVIRAVDFEGFLDNLFGAPVTLVCPGDDVAALGSYLADHRFGSQVQVADVNACFGSIGTDGEAIIYNGTRVEHLIAVSDNPKDEALIAARLSDSIGHDRLVRRLVNDSYVNYMAGLPPYQPSDYLRSASTAYCIAALPRTGSTHLCGLLASHGVGRPTEHIRGGFHRLVNASLFEPADLMDRLVGLVPEQVFGTKLISHFVLSLKDSGARLSLLNGFDRLVVLDRADFVGQALSWALAKRTGTWHVVSAEDGEDYKRERDSISLDSALVDEVQDGLEFMQRERQALSALVEASNHQPLRLDYSDVIQSPADTVEAIANFVGVDVLIDLATSVQAQQMHSPALLEQVRNAVDVRQATS